MDFTGFVFFVVMAGAAFYVLFHTIRGAVLSALRKIGEERSSSQP